MWFQNYLLVLPSRHYHNVYLLTSRHYEIPSRHWYFNVYLKFASGWCKIKMMMMMIALDVLLFRSTLIHRDRFCSVLVTCKLLFTFHDARETVSCSH